MLGGMQMKSSWVNVSRLTLTGSDGYKGAQGKSPHERSCWAAGVHEHTLISTNSNSR